MRRSNGQLRGRHAIGKVNLHLYRLRSYQLLAVTPRKLEPDGGGNRRFTFDPSGRAVTLFATRVRTDSAQWRPARAWELPGPITCRTLGHAEFELTEAAIQGWVADAVITAGQAAAMRAMRHERFPSEAALRASLTGLPGPVLGAGALHRILATAIVPDCARAVLLPPGGGEGAVGPWSVAVCEPVGATLEPYPRDQVAAGDLSTGFRTTAGKLAVIDAERGLGALASGVVPDDLRVDYCAGLSGPVGAGSYARNDIVVPATAIAQGGGGAIAVAAGAAALVLKDSATYGPVADIEVAHELALLAADGQRPYVELTKDLTIRATGPGARLVLDGWWLGGRGPRTVRLTAAQGASWDRVTIRRTTLDPGGVTADAVVLGPVTLEVAARVRELVVSAAILGPVTVSGFASSVMLSDSILDARSAAAVALDQADGRTEVTSCTVIGRLRARELHATALLATGTVEVEDVQSGCLRFSAVAPSSRAPRPYRTTTVTDSQALFTSNRFGDPGYLQLVAAAPDEIARGGPDGTEIGVWASQLNPIKAESLRAKVEEFLPFGLIPTYILES
jgi:hypothetical protein